MRSDSEKNRVTGSLTSSAAIKRTRAPPGDRSSTRQSKLPRGVISLPRQFTFVRLRSRRSCSLSVSVVMPKPGYSWPGSKVANEGLTLSFQIGWPIPLGGGGPLTPALSSDRFPGGALSGSCGLGYPVDLGHLRRRQHPARRLGVQLELLGLGGAGDHARDLRPASEPAEGELQQAVTAGRREILQPLGNLPIGLG